MENQIKMLYYIRYQSLDDYLFHTLVSSSSWCCSFSNSSKGSRYKFKSLTRKTRTMSIIRGRQLNNAENFIMYVDNNSLEY